MAERVRRAAGSPDILINNAGMNLRKPLLVMQTNLDSAFLCSRAFVPGMIAKHFGRVINIASTMAHVALAHRAAYCASKFGILGMTKALALELAPHGVTANTISPGPFATEMNTVLMQDPARNAQFISHIPVGRWGQAEELGPLVTFLCSEAAGFITGADIVIDGGWTAQ
jgi:NAD(P)-dependent dehydrogenase (short-subunit alcohol dehydrogenase family)